MICKENNSKYIDKDWTRYNDLYQDYIYLYQTIHKSRNPIDKIIFIEYTWENYKIEIFTNL